MTVEITLEDFLEVKVLTLKQLWIPVGVEYLKLNGKIQIAGTVQPNFPFYYETSVSFYEVPSIAQSVKVMQVEHLPQFFLKKSNLFFLGTFE